MGTCVSQPQDAATPDDVPLEREVDIDRKESMIRPIVQNRNAYVYNSFTLGYKQLGVGLNGAVRAVRHKSTGISYGK